MKPFQKWLLWASTLVTAVSGGAYGWMKYLMEPAEPWAVINHPLEPWMLKAHILAAPVMVFAFGLIAADHAWKHYRCRVPMGRRSGIAAGLFFFPMAATGYLIQAVTHQGWLEAMVWAHLVTGVVYLAGLVAHQKLFRSRRNGVEEKRAEASPPAGRAEPDGLRLPTGGGQTTVKGPPGRSRVPS